MPTTNDDDDSQADFEILSYNVRWLGNEKKRKKELSILKSILLAMPLFLFKKHTQPKRMRCYGNFNGMEISSLVMALPTRKVFLIAFRYGLEYKYYHQKLLTMMGGILFYIQRFKEALVSCLIIMVPTTNQIKSKS